jgi:hypothetical protein
MKCKEWSRRRKGGGEERESERERKREREKEREREGEGDKTKPVQALLDALQGLQGQQGSTRSIKAHSSFVFCGRRHIPRRLFVCLFVFSQKLTYEEDKRAFLFRLFLVCFVLFCLCKTSLIDWLIDSLSPFPSLGIFLERVVMFNEALEG